MKEERPVKEERHQAVLRIIREKDVSTQEQLAAALRQTGYEVTQATVSRDIRELRLMKVAGARGEYRYAVPPRPLPPDALGRVQRTFQDYVTEITFSGNLLLLKSLPGSAQVVAAALDSLSLEGVAGTVAGDDAVLVIVQDGRPSPAPGVATDVYQRFLAWREADA